MLVLLPKLLQDDGFSKLWKFWDLELLSKEVSAGTPASRRSQTSGHLGILELVDGSISAMQIMFLDNHSRNIFIVDIRIQRCSWLAFFIAYWSF